MVRIGIVSKLAHGVVTLGFCCVLVATSDNVVKTLSRCVSDVVTTTTNVVTKLFSTTVFRPGINVVATS